MRVDRDHLAFSLKGDVAAGGRGTDTPAPRDLGNTPSPRLRQEERCSDYLPLFPKRICGHAGGE
jgi:hypothetical protein